MLFDQFKPLIQKTQEFFRSNIVKNKKRNDGELECLQFGICSMHVKSPKPEELFFR